MLFSAGAAPAVLRCGAAAPALLDVCVWRDVVTAKATDARGTAERSWRLHCHECAVRFVARGGFLLQRLAAQRTDPAPAAGAGRGGCAAEAVGAWYSPSCNPLHCEWASLLAAGAGVAVSKNTGCVYGAPERTPRKRRAELLRAGQQARRRRGRDRQPDRRDPQQQQQQQQQRAGRDPGHGPARGRSAFVPLPRRRRHAD